MNVHERLAVLGAAVPEVLLPGPGTELEKWAVIACDQFTQDRAKALREPRPLTPPAVHVRSWNPLAQA
ncbi:hypothetical protein FACS189473_5610 [Spirochaetia bacterium]|nr:hypothetical protein FACS189473_5610 [Spirochaetia bacterium]